MASPQEFRLYTFVAHHYLLPLQCGLQTAHVVSELSQHVDQTPKEDDAYGTWAVQDKTIIICGASNHQGVVDCFTELQRLGSALLLPHAIFREDEQSMNGMATACGVIVPRKYWDVKFFEAATTVDMSWLAVKQSEAYWEYAYEKDGQPLRLQYPLSHPEGQFISHIKKYRLA